MSNSTLLTKDTVLAEVPEVSTIAPASSASDSSLTSPPGTQKVTKEEFVTYTATHIILTRHMKPLTSAQRKQLRIKTAKEAQEIVRMSALFFCQAHMRQSPQITVDRLIKYWLKHTKNDRLRLYTQAIQMVARQKMVEQFRSQYPECNDDTKNDADSQ